MRLSLTAALACVAALCVATGYAAVDVASLRADVSFLKGEMAEMWRLTQAVIDQRRSEAAARNDAAPFSSHLTPEEQQELELDDSEAPVGPGAHHGRGLAPAGAPTLRFQVCGDGGWGWGLGGRMGVCVGVGDECVFFGGAFLRIPPPRTRPPHPPPATWLRSQLVFYLANYLP
jgi:hypothetical protein